MESNRALEGSYSFASLRNITAQDLEALLYFDSPPLSSQASRLVPCSLQTKEDVAVTSYQNDDNNLHFNREQLPSQMDSQIDTAALLRSPAEASSQFDMSWHLSNHYESSPSIIISTQRALQVSAKEAAPFSINLTESIDSQIESSHLSKSSSSKNITKKNHDTLNFPIEKVKSEPFHLSAIQDENKEPQDPSFAAEFEKFHNFDFDLQLEPLDLAHLDELERSHKAEPKKKSPVLPLIEPRLHKTQVSANKVNAPHGNVTSSCPVLNNAVTQKIITSNNIITDPLHFLTLEFSRSSQESKSTCIEAHVSNKPKSPVAAIDLSRRNVNNIHHASKDNSVMLHTTVHNASASTHQSSAADITMVPPSVKQLYDIVTSQYSDFAFVYALSAQLCQERVPMDCFVNLKIGLLLSLASIGHNPDRPPIPIVVLGNDTYMANFLMSNIGQLAGRFVGPTDDVKPPSNTPNQSNMNWIEADPILLAKGGIFFVGDWSRLKLARADQLFKIIECSRVPVEKTTQVYKLEAAIWTHWRSSKGNAKDQQNFNKIIKIFGIPLCMDDDNHEVLVNYIIEQSSVRIFESTIDHLSISSEDMRKFLRTISKRTVDLTPEASLLLQKYFVTSRLARPECLTKQAFVILKQFAESFAKLCFRHEVLESDAIAAIFMCERFVQSVFGVNENSPPALESHNFIGSVDEYIIEFRKWLHRYIEKYYNKE